MVAWYVDGGLKTLNQQVRDKHPGIIIGTIGDESHQGGTSDHNPENDGSVDAADFMIGKAFTTSQAQALVDTLVQYKDRRIAYIIWNHHIISSTIQPWVWRTYNGASHTDHIHLSVNDKHENDRSEWQMAEKMRNNAIELDGMHLPVLKQGETDAEFGGYDLVKRVQRLVGVEADGDYGPKTAAAIKTFCGGGTGKTVAEVEWNKLYGLSSR